MADGGVKEGKPIEPADLNIEQKQDELRDLLRQVRKLSAETSPITPDMAAAAPTWRAAYSDRTAALMSALCLIAYDQFEELTGATAHAMRIRLASGGFRLINTYNPKNSTQAYLAVSEQFAVLVFRGTTDATDWRSNLNARLESLDPERPAIKVHAGFLDGYRQVHPQILEDLKAHVPPTLGLYITGHSLGGALAQIAAALLARDNLAACYTFGSPRVGGHSFDAEVKCPHYRVVNAADIVPGVPPPVWRGYYHNGDVRWLRRRGGPPSRYNRRVLSEIIKSIVALLALPFIRKLTVVEDHMIWNYEAKLAAVADARAPVPPRVATLVEPEEIRARLEMAVFAAARRRGVIIEPSARERFAEMAGAAAKGVVAQTPRGLGRDAAITLGETMFEALVEDMVSMTETARGSSATTIGLEALKASLATLGPCPPLW